MSHAPEANTRLISIADLFFLTAAVGGGLVINRQLWPVFRVWGTLGRQWALRISDFEQVAAPHLFMLTCALFFSYLWHYDRRAIPRPMAETGWIAIAATSLCLTLKLGSIAMLDATDSYLGDAATVPCGCATVPVALPTATPRGCRRCAAAGGAWFAG